MISQSATLIGSSKHKQNTSYSVIATPIIHDIINEFETIQNNTLMDVLHIREEIFNKAMDICYKNYMEKQAIRFFVQCSYEAWMKILRLKFYQHDDRSEFYQKLPNIGQDKYPIPSIPDTWATNTAQIYDPLFKEYDGITGNDELNDETHTIMTTSAKSGEHLLEFTHIQLNEKTNVNMSEGNLGEYLMPEEATDGIPVPNPSEVSSVDQESVPTISLKAPSYFTSIAISAAKKDDLQAVLSKTIPHKVRHSMQKYAKVKAPRTCNDMQHPKGVQLEDLPPVRAPATFKYNIFSEEERKRTADNKKTSKLNQNN